ncbi:hypothetical protein [Rubellicoccus peritrichatus]|uniref:Uncharacterized protein n=1 Tax=Rubellicoccus peritrichatus TaxID=3080537 RepID=A0AAQ3QSX0_9BACT|nr:hypothetical protein [Puniceicoccus sp. CR14]WOO43058.1 hypothetical protein RZN69_08125 [Puniceicoccus sp. CR14]
MKKLKKRKVGMFFVILIVLFLLGTEAFTYFINVSYRPDSLPQQYFRIILTIPLAIGLLLGYTWARWLTGLLSVFATWGAAVTAIMLLRLSENTFLGGFYLFLCAGYLFAAWALLMSESVKSYIRYMRRHG